jgi:hypothetical protein
MEYMTTCHFHLNVFLKDWHATFPRAEVEGKGDTLTPSNSYVDEVNILKESILRRLRWCDTPRILWKLKLYSKSRCLSSPEHSTARKAAGRPKTLSVAARYSGYQKSYQEEGAEAAAGLPGKPARRCPHVRTSGSFVVPTFPLPSPHITRLQGRKRVWCKIILSMNLISQAPQKSQNSGPLGSRELGLGWESRFYFQPEWSVLLLVLKGSLARVLCKNPRSVWTLSAGRST